EGYDEGLKEGMDAGKKEGIKKGIKEGIKEGSIKKQREIAIEMLNNGMDFDIIEKITKISKEELEKLNNGI
ncbi:MAG: hypothetical protein ACI4U0_06670, partial [Candidatus Aphodocola sp.]